MKIFILISFAIAFYLFRVNVMAAPILKIGDDAPTFTLPDSQGNQVSLNDYKGKWVVLYFYPKDDTPGCTKEADRKSTRLNSSHVSESRMPSSA